MLKDRQPTSDQLITPRERLSQRQFVQLLAEGKSMKAILEAAGVLEVAPRIEGFHLTHSCSLPRGHKGPHILLNPR